MVMVRRKRDLVKQMVAGTAVLALLAGCSGGGGNGGSDAAPSTKPSAEPTKSTADLFKDPIELSFFYKWGEEGFVDSFPGLKEKFPNVTFKLVPKLEQEMIATGNIPDILWLDNWGKIADNLRDGYQFDLTPLIKTYKTDLSSIEPGIMKSIEIMGDGKIYALPIAGSISPLVYNPEIFDKFGVPYPDPKKPMTWDEAIELAKKLTKNEGGVQYRGMDLNVPTKILEERMPVEVDPNDFTPQYSKNPLFKQYLEYVKQFFTIPGNLPAQNPDQSIHNGTTDFVKDRNVAMFVQWDSTGDFIKAEKESGLKWNLAPMPVWKDAPTQGPVAFANALSISPNSKYKDQAFQILAYILSDEYQINIAKKGRVPVTFKEDVIKHFAADVPELKSKKTEAYWATKPVVIEKGWYNRYSNGAAGMWNVGPKLAKDLNWDINSILRELDEKTEKKIAELKAQGK